MKHLRARMAVALFCVAASPSLLAQEDVLYPHLPPKITYGAELGANYNMFSLDMDRTLDLQNSPFDAYRSGTGISPYLFAWLDYGLSKRFGMQFKLGVDSKRVGNSADGVADCVIPRPGGSVEYRSSDLRLEYEVVTTWLTLGALARFNVTPQIFLTAGPTLHIRADSTSQLEIEDVPADGVCVFEDGTTHRETRSRIQSDPTLRAGIETSIGYRHVVSSDLTIIPQLRYQFMISDFIEDRASEDKYQRFSAGTDNVMLTNTQLHSVQLGVGFQFDL